MKTLNKTQTGRSMIEMMGVISIIGMLSLGAIELVANAMNKHNLNKTVEEIYSLMTNIRTLYAPRRDYAKLSIENLIKAGAISSNICYDDDCNFLKTTTGKKISLSVSNPNMVQLTVDVPRVSCVPFVLANWGDSSSRFISIYFDQVFIELTPPITIAQATDACNQESILTQEDITLTLSFF